MKTMLFVALALVAGSFAVLWFRALCARPAGAVRPGWRHGLLGFGTNFFDTLGVGSFAPTAAIFRLTRAVPDAWIPGTMNVGHTLPVVVMAFIYIAIVDVDPVTLGILILAAVLGAWVGAGVVSRLPQRPIQLGIGAALIAAALLMTMGLLGITPLGGTARGLAPGWLAVAALISSVLGALNTIGVGFYGPCMIAIALLGMDPKVAFPIMMGACAFLMPVGSARFVQRGAYDPRAALGLMLGGIPAVLLAAFVVESLSLDVLRWLVVAVACYTAALMLWSARDRGPRAAATGPGGG